MSDAAVTSIASSEQNRDYPPMPALAVADHGVLGRWVESVVSTSEQRIQESVEKLESVVHEMKRRIESLYERRDLADRQSEHVSQKLDAVNSQLQQVIGKLEVILPAVRSQAHGDDHEKQQAGFINERTLPILVPSILAIMMLVTLYALIFGDAAIDRKLDQINPLSGEVSE